MARPRWNSSINRFASRAWRLAAAALALAATCVALRGERADACGWDGPVLEELTTFDPRIAEGEAGEGLYYNPYVGGYGEACSSCAREAMLADWHGYLGEAVTAEDWGLVLIDAGVEELDAIHAQLGKKEAGTAKTTGPAGHSSSSLWKDVKARPKLRAAVELVRVARLVEQLAQAAADEARAGVPAGAKLDPKARAAEARRKEARAAELLARVKAGLRGARAPFLAQRYGFQLIRLLFYQRRWTEVVEAFDQHATQLAAPSVDVAWRGRYYAAGAALRSGQRARGNLELARIHAGYAPLAGQAANDFRPMEEADWRESLRLARSAKEQAELWRLVGVTRDGLVAMREIMKLDPGSPLVAMLMVREVERAEARTGEPWGMAPDPKGAKAEEQARRELASLEQLATSIAGTAGADRPWLMTLVAGHLAARRGDLAAAKRRLLQSLSARPDDARVKNQVHASLALALVRDGAVARASAGGGASGTAARANEVAEALQQVAPDFGRWARLRGEVRGQLAEAYAAANRLIEAELLQPGILASKPATTGKWHDVAFLKAMIARVEQASAAKASPFDRLLRDGSYARTGLERELAMRYLTSGAFGEAAKLLAAEPGPAVMLGTNPFAMRLVDCHDCDHEKYANAPWTHASFAARLAVLERAASGKGEAAAAAALELGNALYNITWHGNARVVLEETHQTLDAPHAAERWYRRAYELSRDRELRARAAFFAAKAELGVLISAAEDAAGLGEGQHAGMDRLPIPVRWFPVVERFADTRYYQEVLEECSHFSAWSRRKR